MSLLINNVSKTFVTKNTKVNVLSKMNLRIEDGEFVSIVGPSGCGKSTLLNIIAGFERTTEGEVFLNDRQIKGPNPDIAIMFQDAALFPWLNVIENIEFALKMKGISKSERKSTALKYLNMVQLEKNMNTYVYQLSGGMKQRVGLARILAIDSKVLLMDEPFAALDAETKKYILFEIKELWKRTGKTFIFVTHNLEEALLLSNRILVMSPRSGTIKKEFSLHSGNREKINLINISQKIAKELKEEVEKVAK